MSLKKFEQKLETLFESFFTKSFKSAVQPVEIAKKLAAEMEAHKTISIARTYVPNEYTVLLSPKDMEFISSFADSLLKELQDFLIEQAKEKSYTLLSVPEIKLKPAEDYSLGKFSIESKLVEKEGEPLSFEKKVLALALLIGEKQVFSLNKEHTIMGRLKTNDITLSDINISREHAEIVREDSSFFIIDLNSTNGTFVNGKKVKRQKLKDGDIITLGKTRFEFREN